MSQVIEPIREAALKRLIAQRAYEIWENQGQPHGCDLIHWREAEQEITECVKQAELAGVPDGSARPEEQVPTQRQYEMHKTEGNKDAFEMPDAIVRASWSFFALVVRPD